MSASDTHILYTQPERVPIGDYELYLMRKFIQKMQIADSRLKGRSRVLINHPSISIKSRAPLLILVIFCVSISVHSAYANHVNWVGDPFSLNVGTSDQSGLATTQVIVR